MVALAHAHEPLQVGSPLYAGGPMPGTAGSDRPVLHKFDKVDFVPRFLAELKDAVGQRRRPRSLLRALELTPDPQVPDFDVDAYDFLGGRFRKLYLPAHFRFYLAACELRCLVPGFPAPMRSHVKKVELVIRRVAVRRQPGKPPLVELDKEWAWVPIPDPRNFPDGAPQSALELAPRLTGNSHTWWPVADGQRAPEGEERQPMTRAFAPGLEASAIYFSFLPIASGEMYGPRTQGAFEGDPDDGMVAGTPEAPPEGSPDPGHPPAPQAPGDVKPIRPLVAAPSSYALSPASQRNWWRNWKKLLGVFSGEDMKVPRPKFEPPQFDGSPDGGWAYVVRTVATFEPTPGCVYEEWSGASAPMLVAPHFDPFGGRPTQIDIPSLGTLSKMIGNLTQPQLAARGAINVGVKRTDCFPKIEASGGKVSVTWPNDECGDANEICFFGIPLFTIAAYLMFSIALILLFPLKFLFRLKFCLPGVK